jgi:hypothetical protein
MQPITEWLADLGLGQYAQVFAENGIDFGVLPELTDPRSRVDRDHKAFAIV